MKTQITSYDQARQEIHTGVNKLADVVTITLGAKGRNVALALTDYKGEIYKRDVIHDGVRVARAVNLVNENENMGASILREAAEKTVMKAGDGTTLTILLSQAIYNEAYRMVATGQDPVEIREGLERSVKSLVDQLQTFATPITTVKQAAHIATISSQDKELGQMIADIMFKLGQEGVVQIEESKNNSTTVEYQTGMQLDKGYMNAYFVTHPETMTAVLENPYILVTDTTISSLEPMGKLLNELHDRQASLVIISPSITTEILGLLIQNKVSAKLSNLCITAPSFGDNQKNLLQDIAYLTGSKFISSDAAFKFEELTLDDLGRCDYIKATKDSSIIVGGRGDRKMLEKRIESIKHQLSEETDDFLQEKLKERLGKLTDGIAVIYVGGFTEIEMKERKERVIDAVAATRAAMKKGIVPGGEVVFLILRNLLGQSVSEQILFRALEKPFNKLVENAGMNSGEMRERLNNSRLKNAGVDVMDGEIKDMIKAGIVDPVLVLEEALYNSVSVATQLMLTEAIIVPESEVKLNEKRK